MRVARPLVITFVACFFSLASPPVGLLQAVFQLHAVPIP